MTRRPVVLGLGGSTRPGSSSEAALDIALEAARTMGAMTRSITGRGLMLPIYDTQSPERTAGAIRLVEAVRECDGLIISAPGYHGSMPGMLKNALDYLEDLRADDRPYLDGLPVGCIAVAHGWQATVSTLNGLRDCVHALRGWPSPYGATINGSVVSLGGEHPVDPAVVDQLALVARQVTDMAGTTINAGTATQLAG